MIYVYVRTELCFGCFNKSFISCQTDAVADKQTNNNIKKTNGVISLPGQGDKYSNQSVNQSISMNLLWRPTSKALGARNTVKIQQHNSVTIMIQRRGESLV